MKKITMILIVIGLLAMIASFAFSQNLSYGIQGVHTNGTKKWACTTANPTLWYTVCDKGATAAKISTSITTGP
ncbi:MAG: hypothetical protein HQK57_02050 [Deltaproteobacteria bacterium]|nr:hypothetical protein [Deltaproteobacteria bacterium]MBF0507693.1 hypothetical protein [Deltaproteobacteria bacterium]